VFQQRAGAEGKADVIKSKNRGHDA
jgi:hypothetical protein